MPTKHLLIKGKVQGVFFRATAKDVAQTLGVTGWIKNTEAGDVEATVSGTEEQLNAFIDWCKKGPSSAVVKKVHVYEEQETAFEKFTVVRE